MKTVQDSQKRWQLYKGSLMGDLLGRDLLGRDLLGRELQGRELPGREQPGVYHATDACAWVIKQTHRTVRQSHRGAESATRRGTLQVPDSAS